MGKLILVGAGPGDPELITVKGLNALKNADVILYDSLIDKRLLENAKRDSKKKFVGKRGYEKSVSQDKINAMCVMFAKEYETVVRLKGGDPFIFGRGNEEVAYAASHGIATEVIPGLSSSTALATLHGIPLTLRDVTRGFSVVSAVDKDGQLSDELLQAVHHTLTVVVLMGLNMLKEICLLYKEAGKSELAVLVIQNGSMPNEKSASGSISSIERLVAKNKISSPALIIIGEVVNHKIKQESVNG